LGLKGTAVKEPQLNLEDTKKPADAPAPTNAAPPDSDPAAAASPVAPVGVTAIVPEEPMVEGAPARMLSAFSGGAAFELGQRMAKALAASSLLPDTFRGNIPNCMIAMELANRIGCSVFQIAQNMDVIHGRPSLRAQFLIATTNASGKFTPIRYRWQGKVGEDDWGCRAYAQDLKNGEECVGPLITIGLAKAEGWYAKAGSKWKTIPELMLTYRAGAWWTRIYCPEFGMGMSTAEEVIDTHGETVVEAPAALRPGSTKALEAALQNGAR
jgi:hypothetical protein